MKPKSTFLRFLLLAGSSMMAVSSASAQTTYTWANSNVNGATPPTSLNWFNATQGIWTGGTPVSSNLNTIQFFQDNTTTLPNTAARTQASVLDYGSAFELGTLTLSGRGSASANANLIMNLSGDALNFSAATGTINLDALNNTRTITYNVANNIQLGTASSGSVLTFQGNGTSAFNFTGEISELQVGGGSLVKNGSSTLILTGANSYTGDTTLNTGTLQGSTASSSLTPPSPFSTSALKLNGGTLQLRANGNGSNTTETITFGNNVTLGGDVAFDVGRQGGAGTNKTIALGTLAIGAHTLTNNNAVTGTYALEFGTATASGAASFISNSGGSSAQGLKLGALTLANSIATGTTTTITVGGTGYTTINGAITDNSGDATKVLALNKTGAGVLVLTGNNTFTGGIVLNQGTLNLQNAQSFTGGITMYGGTLTTGTSGVDSLGPAGSTITVNASSSLSLNGAITLNKSFVLNNNSILSIANGNGSPSKITGPVSGNGGLQLASRVYDFQSTSNTFTGAVSITANTVGGQFVFGSLYDASGAGNLITNSGSGVNAFALGTTAAAPYTLNYRQFVHANDQQALVIRNDNTNAAIDFTINTDLGFSGTVSTRVLTLGGVNIGANAFNGNIGNYSGSAVSLTKSDAGTWILGDDTNSYTGVTTVSGGILQISKLAAGNNNSSIGASSNAASNLILNGGTLRYTGAAVSTDRLFSVGTTAGSAINSSGTGAINFANIGSMGFNAQTGARTLTLTGTNTGNNTIAAIIGDNSGATAITKSGIGTWVLSGANTNTGATGLSGGGKLILDYGTSGGATDNNKIAGVLTLSNGAGDITLRGGSHLEAVTSLTIFTGGGHTSITREPGSTAKIAFGAITRTQSGGVTMSLAEDGLATTTSTTVNGILSGGITVGSNWAKVSSGDIVALTAGDYTALTAAGTTGTVNYQLTGSLSRAAASLNSLRIVGDGDNQVLEITSGNLTPSPLSGSTAGTYVGNSAAGGILYAGGGNNNYTITGPGNIQAQNGNQELIIHTHTGTLTVDMALTMGSQGLTKSGAGTLALSKAGTYTGATRVNQGVLQLRHASAAGTTGGGIFIANNAALELANSVAIGTEALTITGTGVGNAGALRNIASNTSSYAGSITLGAGGARINSDASGALTLGGGVVTSLFNDVTFGGAGNTTVETTAISGAGGLVKDGDGILTLSATNTYTGATLVSAGTLFVSGSLVSDVTVSGNATLGGGGAVDGLILGGASLFDMFEAVTNTDSLNATAISFAAAGFGIDNLVYNGAAVDWGTIADGTYTLISGTLDETNLGNFGSGNAYNLGGGRSAYFQEGSLQLVVIPEPGAALLGSLGLLLIFRRRRC
jgi:fibronectin-binding autotransporter adhesin